MKNQLNESDWNPILIFLFIVMSIVITLAIVTHSEAGEIIVVDGKICDTSTAGMMGN